MVVSASDNLPMTVDLPSVDFSSGLNRYLEGNENRLANRLVHDIPGLSTEKSLEVAEIALTADEHKEVSTSFRISAGTSEMTQFRIVISKNSRDDISISWWALKAVARVNAKQRIVTHHKKVKRFLGIKYKVKRWTEIHYTDRGLDTNEMHQVQDHLVRSIKAHRNYNMVTE